MMMENKNETNRKIISRVRMSPIEKAAIEYVAKIEGVKFSEACRMLIRESLRYRGICVGQINQLQQAEGRKE